MASWNSWRPISAPDDTWGSFQPAFNISIEPLPEERNTSAKLQPQKAASPARRSGLRAAINGTQKVLLPGDRLSGSEAAIPPVLQ